MNNCSLFFLGYNNKIAVIMDIGIYENTAYVLFWLSFFLVLCISICYQVIFLQSLPLTENYEMLAEDCVISIGHVSKTIYSRTSERYYYLFFLDWEMLCILVLVCI